MTTTDASLLTLRTVLLVTAMAACAVGFSLQKTQEDKVAYDHSVLFKRTDQVQRRWKAGPSPSAWYYMMGHSAHKRSPNWEDEGENNDDNSVTDEQFRAGNRVLDAQTTATENVETLLDEFVRFLSLKEQGLLTECLESKK